MQIINFNNRQIKLLYNNYSLNDGFTTPILHKSNLNANTSGGIVPYPSGTNSCVVGFLFNIPVHVTYWLVVFANLKCQKR